MRLSLNSWYLSLEMGLQLCRRRTQYIIMFTETKADKMSHVARLIESAQRDRGDPGVPDQMLAEFNVIAFETDRAEDRKSVV